MKTSYYANIKKLQAEGYTNLVAISQGIPRWNRGQVKDFKTLAPSWDLVKVADEDLYTERYIREVLDKLDAKQIVKELGEDAVLLCYEKPGDFCHRNIVADWIERETGLKVEEFVPLSQKAKVEMAATKEFEQISLF